MQKALLYTCILTTSVVILSGPQGSWSVHLSMYVVNIWKWSSAHALSGVASFITTDKQLQQNQGCCFLVQAMLHAGFPFHQFNLTCYRWFLDLGYFCCLCLFWLWLSHMALSRLAVSLLSVSRLAMFRLAVSHGNVTPSNFMPRNVSHCRVSPDNVLSGNDLPGRVSPVIVSPFNVSSGCVSPGNVSPYRVSHGNVLIDRASLGRV